MRFIIDRRFFFCMIGIEQERGLSISYGKIVLFSRH